VRLLAHHESPAVPTGGCHVPSMSTSP
jgi:hypothetical protein